MFPVYFVTHVPGRTRHFYILATDGAVQGQVIEEFSPFGGILARFELTESIRRPLDHDF